MKILLDTHILLWFHIDRAKLSQKAWDIMLDPQNEVYFSAVNIWETQIKHMRNPAAMPVSGDVLQEASVRSGMRALHVKPEHAFPLKTLSYSDRAPWAHKDPFDRMLICQAKAENMLLLTHDELLPYYNEACVVAV